MTWRMIFPSPSMCGVTSATIEAGPYTPLPFHLTWGAMGLKPLAFIPLNTSKMLKLS